MIESIKQIMITVADFDQALHFYSDVLGLPVLMSFPDQQMAFLDCGGVRLYLGLTSDPAVQSNPIVYFTVADIEQRVAQLKEQHVTFIQEARAIHQTETHEFWIAPFKDPEGHVLYLCEDKAI